MDQWCFGGGGPNGISLYSRAEGNVEGRAREQWQAEVEVGSAGRAGASLSTPACVTADYTHSEEEREKEIEAQDWRNGRVTLKGKSLENDSFRL